MTFEIRTYLNPQRNEDGVVVSGTEGDLVATLDAEYPMAALAAVRARADLVGKTRAWLSNDVAQAMWQLPSGEIRIMKRA